MPVTAKICGLSTPETIDAAIAGGASHIGFVFFAKSPRNLSIDRASALSHKLPSPIKIVGVFVDPEKDFLDEVRKHVTLHAIQLHGDERPAFTTQIGRAHGVEVWKAIPVKTAADLATAQKYRGAVHRILYDAKTPKGADLPGGMGLRFDWELLRGFAHPLPWALSGGLHAGNVAEAARITGATLVDVSSGVERAPGIKDVDKIAAFLKATSQL
ncbi:MAG: phosphoribosylanthranilate isomerase [Sphingomonadaceae bacterium]